MYVCISTDIKLFKQNCHTVRRYNLLFSSGWSFDVDLAVANTTTLTKATVVSTGIDFVTSPLLDVVTSTVICLMCFMWFTWRMHNCRHEQPHSAATRSHTISAVQRTQTVAVICIGSGYHWPAITHTDGCANGKWAHVSVVTAADSQ